MSGGINGLIERLGLVTHCYKLRKWEVSRQLMQNRVTITLLTTAFLSARTRRTCQDLSIIDAFVL